MSKFRLFYVCAFVLASVPAVCRAQVDTRWKIHDRSRPVPPVIEPGTASTQEAPGRAPSDAVALFDGKDLSPWPQKKDGSPAKWKVENGYFEVRPKTGDIQTRQAFGDCQFPGPTAHGDRSLYKPMPEKLPLALQDHNHPVRYRNIWIRDLKPGE